MRGIPARLIVCLALVGVSMATPRAAAVITTQSAATLSGEWTADARRAWRGDDGQPRIQVNLTAGSGTSRWGFGVRLSELDGLPPAAMSGTVSDARFSWTREAGVLHFTGSFDGGAGTGAYQFAPSAAYAAAMSGLGYPRLSAEEQLRLAVLDVTTAYVRELAQAGHARLALDELTRMRIHRVTPAMIQAFARLGYQSLDVATLVRLRIHKVTPEFAEGLAARGYSGQTAADLVRMRIHNVTLAEIDELKALGFGGVSTADLVRFRIHKVTPAFVREMRGVGFDALTEDQLVRLRIHKVDAQFVRDARADGYVMTPGDAIDLAIRGPRFSKARKK